MSYLTSRPSVFGQDLFVASATLVHVLGEQAVTSDGRKFRYVSVEPSATTVTGQTAGATLVAGNVIQSSAQVPLHLNLTPSAATAVADTSFTVTLGATAAFVNQYAGGYVMVSTGPGNGISYRIKSHPLAASAATLLLQLEDPILVATTVSSRMDLQRNIYAGVIQAPITTATAGQIGVAHWALPALITGGATGQNFGWIQTHGACAALITGTPAVGAMLTGTGAAAGAAAIWSGTLQNIGYMLTTGVSGKNNAVYLTID